MREREREREREKPGMQEDNQTAWLTSKDKVVFIGCYRVRICARKMFTITTYSSFSISLNMEVVWNVYGTRNLVQ